MSGFLWMRLQPFANPMIIKSATSSLLMCASTLQGRMLDAHLDAHRHHFTIKQSPPTPTREFFALAIPLGARGGGAGELPPGTFELTREWQGGSQACCK